MSSSTSYALGRAGEALAASYLKEQGFMITARNYRSGVGEIDIIAENRETILFVEVKLRRMGIGYAPREAVTADKRRRLLHATKHFIYRSRTRLQPRFDVIEIIQNNDNDLKDAEVHWIQNAFGVSSDEFF